MAESLENEEAGGAQAEEAGTAHAEAEGTSLGEAKWAAMKELERRFPGLDIEHVEFEVLEDVASTNEAGRAKVLAVADLSAWRATEEAFEWPADPAERVREVLRRIAAHLGLRASVDVEENETELRAGLSGTELGLFIGKHGQTIDAVQFLCAQAGYRGHEQRKRVVIDAG